MRVTHIFICKTIWAFHHLHTGFPIETHSTCIQPNMKEKKLLLTGIALLLAISGTSCARPSVSAETPSPSAAPAQPQANILYKWVSVQGGQAEIDEGKLVEYADGYFCAHYWTKYGKAISALNQGDILIIDDKTVEISDKITVSKNQYTIEQARESLNNPNVILQTCADDTGETLILVSGNLLDSKNK